MAIFELLLPIISEISRVASQVITGKLLSDEQIRLISKNAVGAYFADWLPTREDEARAKKRVEEAKLHIVSASQIISELQGDLDNQANQLEQIIKEIEEKRKVAEHYETLAETNEKAFSAFRVEMEESLRKQLQAEADRGKRLRRVVSFLVWIITLILGAALGAYFIQLVEFVRGWLQV